MSTWLEKLRFHFGGNFHLVFKHVEAITRAGEAPSFITPEIHVIDLQR